MQRAKNEAERAADQRVAQGEVTRVRELHQATAAAREWQFEAQLAEVSTLHKAQLEAYARIEEQGGAMGKLAAEVEASAVALQGLREKMERELWKGVLKGEAAMMEKERALNEVQSKREALWAQREALVTSMQGELAAEQARMAAAWQQGQGAWHALQAEHNELRVELQQRRLDGERGSESLQREIERVGEQLQAERQLLQQERLLCRDERRSLSTALLEHKQEVSNHREELFTSVETVAREREHSLQSIVSERAELETQRRAAELERRNAQFERSVVTKERDAVSAYMTGLKRDKAQQDEAREELQAQAAALQARQQEAAEREAASREQRRAAGALAQQTASQAQRVSEQQQLLKEQAREFFKMFEGAVVLVGPTDKAMQDLAPTPFDSTPVPKVSVHGNLYKTLMSGLYIHRLPPWADIVILLGLTALVALLGTATGRSSLWYKAASFGVLTLYIVAVFTLFSRFQLVIPLIAPVACAVTTTTAGAIYRLLVEERQKGRIKGMFGTYLSPDLVERMVDSGEEPQLGGVDETITAFFSDIQSFSSFSELLEPHQLVELMNEYLTAMTDIVHEEGGTLDKYIGDAMVAMFNAPIHIEHHAYHACRAAARIQQRQAALRKKWAEESDKWPPIVPQMRTRIGLNTGHATVGNMGSESRFNYTMMGYTVNLAARCESGAKSAGAYTLVSEQTRNEAAAIGGELVFRFVDKWQVKGRSQPVNMYELVGFRSELTPDILEAVSLYEEALKKYFARDWDGAAAGFEQAAKQEQFQPGRDPGVFLNPSLVMQARCAQMKASPPPEDWNGVFVMKTK